MKNSLFFLVLLLLFFVSCGDSDVGNDNHTEDAENVEVDSDVDNLDENQDLEMEEKVDDADMEEIADDADMEEIADDADMEEIADDHAEESGCVDSSFIEPNPDYESYFALNVVAEINPDGSISEMTEAIYKDFNIKIKDHPEIMLDSSMVSAFFVEDDTHVFIGAFGDRLFHGKHQETSILAMISRETLISMKSIDFNYIDEVPRIQMNTLEELPDNIAKSCITGLHDFSSTDHFFPGLGKTKICMEENEDFSVGEFIRIGFNANLVTDKEEIAWRMGLEPGEEYCNCWRFETYEEVDCP